MLVLARIVGAVESRNRLSDNKCWIQAINGRVEG